MARLSLLRLMAFAGALAWVAGAQAVERGQGLAQVLAEKGPPLAKLSAGDTLVLRYSDCTLRFRDGRVVDIARTKASGSEPDPAAGPLALVKKAENPAVRIEALQEEERTAVGRVLEIVNQPVASLPQEPGMNVGDFGGGWFDEGAQVPDFDTADAAQTQQVGLYVDHGHEYGTSRLNPGIVFRLADLAYNPSLRFFYRDLTVPKKRLSPEELAELTQLFREIGRCNRDLGALGEKPRLDGS